VTPGHVDYAAYREQGGYALAQSLAGGAQARDEIVGGDGRFGLARSWRRRLSPPAASGKTVASGPAPRLMAINIDEGEPGTFKDRYYLERDPHRFLEGALIAAWAVGIDEIYIYLRDEYHGCREILENEIAALRTKPTVRDPSHPSASRARAPTSAAKNPR